MMDTEHQSSCIGRKMKKKLIENKNRLRFLNMETSEQKYSQNCNRDSAVSKIGDMETKGYM